MRLKNLNGWQRLFALISIIVAAWILLAARVPSVEPNVELALMQVSPKYAKSIKDGKKEYSIEEFILALGTGLKEFKMPDGVVISENPEILTQEEVEEAYKLAKEKAKSDYWDMQLSSYLDAFSYYLIAMTSLYAFGWMVAWVIRGFKK